MPTISSDYKVKINPSLRTNYRRNVVSFGDGYQQRSKTGINAVKQSWSVTFTDLTEIKKKALQAIIDDAAGVVGIDWIAPGEIQSKRWLVADPVTNLLSDDLWEISCTMELLHEF
jgi:phage-related protein